MSERAQVRTLPTSDLFSLKRRRLHTARKRLAHERGDIFTRPSIFIGAGRGIFSFTPLVQQHKTSPQNKAFRDVHFTPISEAVRWREGIVELRSKQECLTGPTVPCLVGDTRARVHNTDPTNHACSAPARWDVREMFVCVGASVDRKWCDCCSERLLFSIFLSSLLRQHAAAEKKWQGVLPRRRLRFQRARHEDFSRERYFTPSGNLRKGQK